MRSLMIAVLCIAMLTIVGCGEPPLSSSNPLNSSNTELTLSEAKNHPLMRYGSDFSEDEDVLVEWWEPTQTWEFARGDLGYIVIKVTFGDNQARTEWWRQQLEFHYYDDEIELLNAHEYVAPGVNYPEDWGNVAYYHLNHNDEVLIPFRFLKVTDDSDRFVHPDDFGMLSIIRFRDKTVSGVDHQRNFAIYGINTDD